MRKREEDQQKNPLTYTQNSQQKAQQKVKGMPAKQERNSRNHEEKHLEADASDNNGKAVGMPEAECFPKQ